MQNEKISSSSQEVENNIASQKFTCNSIKTNRIGQQEISQSRWLIVSWGEMHLNNLCIICIIDRDEFHSKHFQVFI